MPLTYHDVMTTQLHMLEGAAKAWKKMGNRFGELKTNLEDHVLKVTGDGSWRGEGFQAATSAAGVIKHEYGAAKAEALAIGQILQEAYTQFHGLKQSIDKIVKDAESKGYKVNAQTGEVKYDWERERLTPEENRAMKNDPSFIAEAERDFTNSIKKLVQKVDDADQGVKLALTTAVTDQDGKGAFQGFNSAAEGDMEKVEAKRASQLAEKIKSGEELSGKQQEEMSVLMRDNSGDKAFSKTFLTGIGGAEGTVQLSKKMAELGYGHDVRTGMAFEHQKGQPGYLGLENSLARTVATATKVPGAVSKFPPGSEKYKEWLKSSDGEFYSNYMEDLKEVGTEEYGDRPNSTRGYQSFVSMMKNGNAEFDDHFLHQLGDDIIAAEDKDGSIWTRRDDGVPGVESDPLDGVMGLMSKDPDTATAFLDPSGTDNLDKNDHLKYLLKDREWPEVLSSQEGYGLTSVDDPSGQAGFGKALEAAATGHQPGEASESFGTHTASQARVMHESIQILDAEKRGDELDEALRKPMARMFADYSPDTHDILATNDGNGGYAAGTDGVWVEKGNAHIAPSQESLLRVVRGVSEDPDAYAHIYNSQRGYAAEVLDGMPADSGKDGVDWSAKVKNVGGAFGAMNAVGADVIYDKKDDRVEWAENVQQYSGGTASAGLGDIPVVGSGASAILEHSTYNWVNDIEGEAELKARGDASSENSAHVTGTNELIDEWAKSRGMEPRDREHETYNTVAELRGEAGQSYGASRQLASTALEEQ